MRKAKQTGVIVFTESVKQLSIRKQLFYDDNRNRLIHRQLLKKAKVVVEGLPVPVIWWDERFQQGGNFTERLYHALQTQFQIGYDRLIVIGTDHPTLNKRHIEKAVKLVSKGSQVLGPAVDGGCYLFSVTQNDFEAFRNAGIHWQNGNEKEEILNFFAERQQECFCLETLEDIDSLADIRKLIGSKGHLTFIRILSTLLWLNQSVNKWVESALVELADNSLPKRAPPLGN